MHRKNHARFGLRRRLWVRTHDLFGLIILGLSFDGEDDGYRCLHYMMKLGLGTNVHDEGTFIVVFKCVSTRLANLGD